MVKQVDFIGIGAAKSATTWLADCLRSHPQIFIPEEKELNFFNEKFFGKTQPLDNNYNRGLDWYLTHFFKKNNFVQGEFSPTYLSDKKASTRIKKHFPQAKIIVSLRHPAETLQSFYWYDKRSPMFNITSRSFDQAVRLNQKSELKFDHGFYYRHLQRYYKLFPKENIHVILFENIKSCPQKVIKDLCRFLQINNNFTPGQINKKSNSAKKQRSSLLKKASQKFLNLILKLNLEQLHHRIVNNPLLFDFYQVIAYKDFSYPEMKDATYNYLVDYYHDDIKALSRLIDKDLSNWLKKR